MKLTAFRKFILGLFFAILLLISAFLTSYWFSRDLYNRFGWVEHTYQVVNKLRLVHQKLSESDANVRAFAVTGEEDYLEGYHRSIRIIHQETAALRILIKGNPQLNQQFVRLQYLLDKRIAMFNTAIGYSKGEQPEELHEVSDRMLEGKRVSDQIKALLQEVEQQEALLLAERKEQAGQQLTCTGLFILLAGSLALLVIFLMLYKLYKDIQHRVQTEEKLSEQKKFNDTVAQTTPDLLYVYDFVEGGNVYANKEQSQMLGYTQQEVQAKGGEFLTELLHPEDMPLVADFQKKLLGSKENQVCSLEYRMRHKKGHYCWLLSREVIFTRNAAGVPLQKLGITQEITARKEPELALQKQQALLQQVIDTSPAFISIRDIDGQFLLVNRALARYFGSVPEAIIGKKTSDLIGMVGETTTDAAEMLLDHQFLIQGTNNSKEGPVVVEQKIYNSVSGKDHWFQVFKAPLHTQTLSSQILCIANDITLLKETEAQLIETREVALQSIHAKEMFLSNMSHEIRTPINAVIGMTHLLQGEEPRADQLEHLQLLRFSAENLLVLVNDILDYSKIEAGKITFERIEFSLVQLLESMRRSHLYKADDKGIAIQVVLKSPIDYQVVGDPTRLTQILNNLMSNAVKFTEQGNVVMQVQIRKRGKQLRLFCSITDTGIGIAPDKLEDIFESFTQASADTTRKYGGTGLGLSITKRLVDLMGGRIRVRSKLGSGTCFQFFIPLEKGNRVDELNEEVYDKDHYFDLSHIQLLLVEDNKANRMVATKFLQKWGIVPDYAENGVVAVEKVLKKRFDIVLMDLQMPEMDGYEATTTIRTLIHEKLPIIALTASAMLEVKDRVFAVGMNDYISKPFNPRELHDKIVKYVPASGRSLLENEIKAVESQEKSTAPINFNAIREMAPGDEAFHREMVELYSESFRELQIEYPQKLQAGNFPALKALRHRVHPTLITLQAKELQQLLNKTEEVLADATTERRTTHACHVAAACESIIKALVEAIVTPVAQ